MKAGRQGELPKGSMKLGSSRSGATVYMQPEPLVELNNTYSSLVDQVEEAEIKVLTRLAELVERHSSGLMKVICLLSYSPLSFFLSQCLACLVCSGLPSSRFPSEPRKLFLPQSQAKHLDMSLRRNTRAF